MSEPSWPEPHPVRTWWPAAAGAISIPVLWTLGILADFSEGVVVAALLYLAWGLIRRRQGDRPWLASQLAGVLLFGAVTMVALFMVDNPMSQYLLAAGWLGHAAWDVVHYRANRIVPRWWSLWCVVLDVLLAVVLITSALVVGGLQ